jgi:TRAP-type uncharacterized transport system fused permease subunit
VAKTVLAIGLWGVAVIGWMGRPLALWQRGFAMVAAAALVVALPATDAVGLVLVFGFAAQHLFLAPRSQ